MRIKSVLVIKMGLIPKKSPLGLRRLRKIPKRASFMSSKTIKIVGQLECRYPVLDEEGRKFGYINLFYLLPEFRNQGLGRQLQDFLLKLFANHGCRYARLRYIPGNDAGERFYYKNGWRPVRDPGDRGQLMQIDLLEYI